MDNFEIRTFDNRVEYYIDGLLHRDCGPAIEFNDGTKEWYKWGKLHREDGPAYEGVNGYKAYWLNGVKYKRLNEFNIATIAGEHYIAINK